MRQAIKEGFDFNSFKNAINGKYLKRYSSTDKFKKIDIKDSKGNVTGQKDVLTASPKGNHASHPRYTEEVMKRLNNYKKRGLTAKESAEKVCKEMSVDISNLQPNNTINDLFK